MGRRHLAIGSAIVVAGLLCGQVQAQPQNMKTVVADATYVMGDSDTLAGAEDYALLRAKRKAVEEAGVYIEASSTDVETRAGERTTRLNQLSIQTIAAAVTETEVLEKRRTLDGDRPSFYVKIRATVHLELLAEAVKRLKSDEQLAAHHRQLQTENSQLKTQVETLREQLKTAGGTRREPAATPADRRAAVELGRAAAQSRSLPEKIELASRAIAADDRYLNAYVIRGQTYLRIASVTIAAQPSKHDVGDYVDRAMADFDKALALDPASTWALLGRGDALTWQKNMREAADAYERILRLDPLFDIARQRLIALATAEAKQAILAKQWRQALIPLERALPADPPQSWVAQDKDVYLLRSQLYAELGEWERALADLSRVIRAEPGNADALLRRGRLHRRLLQGRQAKEDLEQACRLGLDDACTALR